MPGTGRPCPTSRRTASSIGTRGRSLSTEPAARAAVPAPRRRAAPRPRPGGRRSTHGGAPSRCAPDAEPLAEIARERADVGAGAHRDPEGRVRAADPDQLDRVHRHRASERGHRRAPAGDRVGPLAVLPPGRSRPAASGTCRPANPASAAATRVLAGQRAGDPLADRLAGQVVGVGADAQPRRRPGRSWPAARRNAPAGCPSRPGAPAARWRTDPACRCARPTARPAPAGPAPPRRATWGRPACPSAARRSVAVSSRLSVASTSLIRAACSRPAVELEVQLGHGAGREGPGHPGPQESGGALAVPRGRGSSRPLRPARSPGSWRARGRR